MSFVETTRDLFNSLADALFAELEAGEALNLNLAAEDQTYVRFNAAKVRQATAVEQRRLALTYQARGRKLVYAVDLAGQADADLPVLRSLLRRGRAEAAALPEDPYLVPMANHGASDSHHPGRLPDAADLIGRIAEAAAGTDFAGLLATGPQIRATRNSAGQSHWFSTETLFVDYSLYTVNASGENKAVKGLCAERAWDPAKFAADLAANRDRLALLGRDTRPVPPGGYRVYFAPAAMAELVSMFSWGAVSYGAWKKGESAFKAFIEGEAAFSEKFTLRENFGLGLAPRFNSEGEVTAETLPVIERGRLKNLMVSSRSAKEYGVGSNGAESEGWATEALRSPEVAPGTLAEADILHALGTGLYVANLHYLNWSDLHSARVTGMTRYACFWVENGEIVAPIRDLRFDENLYRVFGSELEDLTVAAPILVNTDTYDRRALGGMKVPGLLAGDFRFTL
jgi:predicted Zn-dependent protease